MTPPRDIKLLIADVDGTLVPADKVLSPHARAAAADLRRAGVSLALTSARPPQGMRMLTEPLGLDTPLSGFNGGLIVDPDLHELESHPIAPDVAATALQLLHEAGLDVWIYTETAWFVSRMDGPHVAREAWIIKMVPQLLPDDPTELGRAFKIVGVSDDFAKVSAAGVVAQQRLAGGASATQSAPHFLDVTDVKATKGFVVRSLAQRLGISPAQIATIGDMPNDVLMFRESGFSIAMGNASDAVKAQADAVTDTNERDGFARAVRDLLLPSAYAGAEDRRSP